MLADKLRAATSAAAPLEFVGGYSEGFVGTTSNKTITFGGSLTGGIDTSASEGDLVLVFFATGSTAQRTLVVAGYTQLLQQTQSDTFDTNLVTSYKFQTGTPDTSVVLTGGTGNTADAGTIIIQVWRGVLNVQGYSAATVTQQDATYNPISYGAVTTNNTVLANPPSVSPANLSPASDGCVIVACGAGAHDTGTQTYSSSDLEGFVSVGADDTNDSTIGAGYITGWTSGVVNPAAFTFSGTDNAQFSNVSITLILLPETRLPTYVASDVQTTTSGTTGDGYYPAGTNTGDLVIAFVCTSESRTISASGWTVRTAGSYCSVLTRSSPSTYASRTAVTFTANASTYWSIYTITIRNGAYVGSSSSNGTGDGLSSGNSSPTATAPGFVIACGSATYDVLYSWPTSLTVNVATELGSVGYLQNNSTDPALFVGGAIYAGFIADCLGQASTTSVPAYDGVRLVSTICTVQYA